MQHAPTQAGERRGRRSSIAGRLTHASCNMCNISRAAGTRGRPLLLTVCVRRPRFVSAVHALLVIFSFCLGSLHVIGILFSVCLDSARFIDFFRFVSAVHTLLLFYSCFGSAHFISIFFFSFCLGKVHFIRIFFVSSRQRTLYKYFVLFCLGEVRFISIIFVLSRQRTIYK